MREREFVVLMALLQALQALAIDSMLPALGVMSRDLGVSDHNQRQLVIAVFMISSGLGALFPGILSDRFGRRRMLFICVGSYVLFNFAAAFMNDFAALLVMRGLCGLFSSGMFVLSSAIIRDRFAGDKMARTQSLVSMVFMVVPMAAPSLGQAVMLFAGWRWIFGIMALMGTVLWLWAFFRLPETLHPEFRQPIKPRAIARNMHIALTTRESIGYILGIALIQSTMSSYLMSSQQLIGEHFGAGTAFPLFFGGMALAMAMANLANSRIVERFGARRVSHSAVICYICCAALQLWLASSPHQTLWQFVPVMTMNLCLMGFIAANFQAIAMQPFARIAGSAASLQAFIRMGIGSTLGTTIGQTYDGSARPQATAMFIAGTGALLLVLFSERGRLFRRLHGQVQQA